MPHHTELISEMGHDRSSELRFRNTHDARMQRGWILSDAVPRQHGVNEQLGDGQKAVRFEGHVPDNICAVRPEKGRVGVYRASYEHPVQKRRSSAEEESIERHAGHATVG